MNTKVIHIKVSDIFENQITSRSAIDTLFNKMESRHYYHIDFNDINFLSRAAAHELISLLSEFTNNGIEITLRNISPSVTSMINNVQKSIQTNIKKATYVEYLNLNSEKELDDFLLTV